MYQRECLLDRSRRFQNVWIGYQPWDRP